MMQNDDYEAVVREVQEFLRTIQIQSGGDVTVPVDGIYGDATAAAVRAFQTESGLPVTGTVDKATYDALYEKTLGIRFQNSQPLPLYLFGIGQTVKAGEKSDTVLIVQVMLNALSVGYDDAPPISPDGVFGEETENAVKLFQMRNGLPATGEVNKATWNALVKNYDLLIGRRSRGQG